MELRCDPSPPLSVTSATSVTLEDLLERLEAIEKSFQEFDHRCMSSLKNVEEMLKVAQKLSTPQHTPSFTSVWPSSFGSSVLGQTTNTDPYRLANPIMPARVTDNHFGEHHARTIPRGDFGFPPLREDL